MKTKYLIMQAMEELLSEYAYDQITIAMITRKVPIARQGFYKFYKDKEDLSRQMYLYFTDRGAIMDKEFTLREFILHDLTEINRHMVFFHKLATVPYDNDLFQILHGNIFQIYQRMLCYHLTVVEEDLLFMLDGYCIGGLYQLIQLLHSSTSLDVEHLSDLYIDMIPAPVREVLLNGAYPPEIIRET